MDPKTQINHNHRPKTQIPQIKSCLTLKQITSSALFYKYHFEHVERKYGLQFQNIRIKNKKKD